MTSRTKGRARSLHRRMWFDVGDTDGMRWLTLTSVIGLLVVVLVAWNGGLGFDVPMPFYKWGLVGPTCGLTRGVLALVRGDIALAWRYNPATFLVAGFVIAGTVRVGVGVATRRWLNAHAQRPTAAMWVVFAVVVLAWWAYQLANADFIIHSHL